MAAYGGGNSRRTYTSLQMLVVIWFEADAQRNTESARWLQVPHVSSCSSRMTHLAQTR